MARGRDVGTTEAGDASRAEVRKGSYLRAMPNNMKTSAFTANPRHTMRSAEIRFGTSHCKRAPWCEIEGERQSG